MNEHIQQNKNHSQFLIECILKNKISDWNVFVEGLDESISLKNINFRGLELKKINLSSKEESLIDLSNCNFDNCNLIGVNFTKSKLVNSSFKNTTMEGVVFHDAALTEVDISLSTITSSSFHSSFMFGANLEKTKFIECDFNKTDFHKATLKDTIFLSYKFINSNFFKANLAGCKFIYNIHESYFRLNKNIEMHGANFHNAVFSNETYFDEILVSDKTDFRAIFFDKATFTSGTKQSLEYINRKHNWEEWYKHHNVMLSGLVKFFWSHSRYGISAKRVISCFFISCFIFTIIYTLFPFLLSEQDSNGLIRNFYFSIITMSTLGFGDIHPSMNCWLGQIIVIIQVVYGYILFGSLLTILSNLFNSDGPATGLVKHKDESEISITYTIEDE